MNWTKRQEEIVLKAINIIAKEGIEIFTTKRLAHDVGISEPALYRHFENKYDIIANIIDYVEEQSLQLLFKAENMDMNPYEKVQYFISSRFLLFNANPELAAIIFNDNIFQSNPLLAEKMSTLMKKHIGFLNNNINQAIEQNLIRKDLDPNSIFMIIVGPIRLLVSLWLQNPNQVNLIERGMDLAKLIEKLLKI